MATPVIAGFGALKKCNQYVLSYNCAKFHVCRQIWTILPLFLPKLLDYDDTQGQISQIWPFLIALGLKIFGLAFWLFFGEFGLEDFSLALMLLFWLYFGFFYTMVGYRSTTIEVTELPRTPILPLLYAHSLTNGYLLNCQSQCPVTWHDVTNYMSVASD